MRRHALVCGAQERTSILGAYVNILHHKPRNLHLFFEMKFSSVNIAFHCFASLKVEEKVVHLPLDLGYIFLSAIQGSNPRKKLNPVALANMLMATGFG